MESFYDELVALIPSQFQDKPNIKAILKACSNQYDEVYQVMKDINDMTQIETASGKNLDYIGDIVGMSRQDAINILGSSGEVLSDEVYRRCLKFKTIQNNAKSTYQDIVEGLELLWTGAELTYTEDTSRPSNFVIHLDNVDIDDSDPFRSVPLIIKPAGVSITLSTSFLHVMDIVDEELFANDRVEHQHYAYLDGEYTLNGQRGNVDNTFTWDGEIYYL